MDDVREQIADMIRGMDLEKKPRAAKKEKEEYAALENRVAGIKRDIDKLSLRLWHACQKGDYRSLTIDQAKQELQRIGHTIESIDSGQAGS